MESKINAQSSQNRNGRSRKRSPVKNPARSKRRESQSIDPRPSVGKDKASSRGRSEVRLDTGLRRSPRRQYSSVSSTVDKTVPKLKGVKEVPASCTSSQGTNNFGTYRIPKKKSSVVQADDTTSPDNAEDFIDKIITSASEIVKSQRDESKLASKIIHPPVPLHLFLNPEKYINASAITTSKMKTGDKVATNVTKNQKRNDSQIAEANVQKSGRVNQLKAKRRLPDLSNRTDSCKNNEFVDDLSGTSASSSFKKIFDDLPDYEDSVQLQNEEDMEEENMEWDNPIPQILKLVKEKETSPKEGATELMESITEMDVDMDFIPQEREQIVIVPDTNIWINDLKLIETLLSKEFSKQLIIVIPWMVLQELDVGSHKRGKSQDEMRRPIRFIYTLLSTKHERVKAQKAAEAAISKLKFDEIVADDSILGCALQNQKANNAVIFLSNDKNLLSKALVHGVTAVDSNNVMSTIKEFVESNCRSAPISPISLPPLSCPETSPPFYHTNSLLSKRRLDTGSTLYKTDNQLGINDVEMLEDSEQEMPMPKIRAVSGQSFSSVRQEGRHDLLLKALVKAFSEIIQRKMIEDYGMGGWERVLKIKPPWTLARAIKCMQVHWITNFSFVFTRRGQTHLENLKNLIDKQKFSKTESCDKIQEEIVDSALSLFNCLEKEFESGENVVECKAILLDLAKLQHPV